MAADDARLTRIEAKMDQLADAMISLVRVEERITTIFKRLDNVDTLLLGNAARVQALEKISDGQGYSVRFAERIFWIVLTAAVGAAFVFLKGK